MVEQPVRGAEHAAIGADIFTQHQHARIARFIAWTRVTSIITASLYRSGGQRLVLRRKLGIGIVAITARIVGRGAIAETIVSASITAGPPPLPCPV